MRVASIEHSDIVLLLIRTGKQRVTFPDKQTVSEDIHHGRSPLSQFPDNQTVSEERKIYQPWKVSSKPEGPTKWYKSPWMVKWERKLEFAYNAFVRTGLLTWQLKEQRRRQSLQWKNSSTRVKEWKNNSTRTSGNRGAAGARLSSC